MRFTKGAGMAAATSLWVACAVFAIATAPVAADNTRWGAGYFPNVVLTTQDGTPVRFYDDVVKGKIVAINLIYTTCKYACPLETARLSQVAKLLGDRMGRDVFFYSITIDPDHDTPAVLKAYAEKYEAGPGWTFLTGKAEDIELISKKLGLYSEPNPSNPDGHTPMLLVGNEQSGQWMRNSGLDNPKFLARTIGDWLNSWQTATRSAKSYATMPAFNFDQGEYTFRNHCAACHTIGGGEHFGPDLLGVTATRDRKWLERFIVEPDKVVAAADPIAQTLLARYQQVLMPNLGLGTSDAAVLIDYIEAQSRSRSAASATPATTTKPPAGAPTTLAPIVDPYLRIQRALHADDVTAIGDAARAIAAAAAKLGMEGGDVRSAAEALERATDLRTARDAFGRTSEAILTYARRSGAGVGADVTIAFCPMLKKYWLQKGVVVQNPFYGSQMPECGRLVTDSDVKP